MEAKVIITRTAVKKGTTVSTGRMYDGKNLIEFSTDILTSVTKSCAYDNFIVYNAIDKNGEKYNIVELKSRAAVTTKTIGHADEEVTGIGFDPIEKIILTEVRIHPIRSKLLSCDFLTYSISNVTTIKGNNITVITVFP